MASVSRSRRTTDERTGGKIARGRRIAAAAKTPYDRSAAAARAPPANPNWLTGLVYPTSRMIAVGATKLLSSVFGPDTSSSSSSSGSDSSSEDGMDGENDVYHIPFDRLGSLNKNGATSELNECFREEPQRIAGRSETKRVIEKLLMQETFSWKECDRLIEIINSRVVDGPTMEEEQDGKVGVIPRRTVGDDIDNAELCSKAVMEAKQWLEEKVASSSKSDLDHGTGVFSSVALSQVTELELVSPVDIAKVYMQARPPWTSPSVNYVELGTPSPVGRELLKDDTPYSVAGNSFSSSKNKNSLSNGSWNIQEEIRRVRSKATEDMLKTTPSARIDLSSFAKERKSIQKSLLADKKDWDWEDRLHNLNLSAAKSIDVSLELAGGASSRHGLPASVLELAPNSSLAADLSSQPVIFSSAQNQDLEGIQTVEGEEHAASNSRHLTIPDSRLSDETYSSAKEGTELRGNPNANGFPFSVTSSAAVDDEQNLRVSDDKGSDPVGSSCEKLVNSVPVEEACELLSEASMEIPVTNEASNINTVSGSQNSSSMHCEELSQELTQPNPEHGLTGKTTNAVEKQQGRKPSSRYTRKSRGKG